jgi:zinc ribbon protein
MHCPKCGQQQVSDEMRFCSRCGFPLSVVTEVVSHGGTLPEREAEASAPQLTSRQRGKRLGLLLLLTGIVLAIIAGIINDSRTASSLPPLGLAPTLLIFGPGIICLVAGFVRFLYAVMLEPKTPRKVSSPLQKDKSPSLQLDPAGSYPVLPSHRVPVAEFGERRVNTSEMVNVPPSVTENTTRLLDDES